MNTNKDILKKHSEININEIVRKGRDTKVEENVKIILVKPILECLGYSDKNFDFEHNVKSKKADIAILINGKPQIIVETKDLDENLDNHLEQALDYALKKGIWWVLLTNGIEYRLYISFLPNTEEEARLQLKFTLKELPDKFEQLYRKIGVEHIIETTDDLEKDSNIRKSREAITAKNLLNDLRDSKETLYSAIKSEFDRLYTVDEKFTERIDKWAKEKKIDTSDKEWIEKICKQGAYTLINRILFLRICEDLKHIPSRLNNVGVYVWDTYLHLPIKDLLKISFDKISEKFSKLYESPLFDDIRFYEIKIDDHILKETLGRLKDYNFSGINRDILGPVYERHISRDERRNLGQYYTPDEIINYILEDIKIGTNNKILDPACGSGGFLLKSYDTLKNKMIKEGWAKEALHKAILSDNLFGIDINPFASQLTIMNLLLKDLDNPTNIINVVEGNSILLSLKSFEKQEKPVQVKNMKEHNLSVSDILSKQYDVVVGNPPYISNKRLTSSEIEHFKNNYLTEGRTNTFALFIQRGIQLLKENGKLGMIVHKNLIKSVSYEGTRKNILDKCKIKKIVDLEKGRFEGVTGETIILILEKEKDPDKRSKNMIEICSDVENLAERKYKKHKIKQHVFESFPKTIFSIYMDEESGKIVEKIRKGTIELTNLINPFNGINTGNLEKYVSNKKTDKRHKRCVAGEDIDRFEIKNTKFVLYIPKELHRPRDEKIFLADGKILTRHVSGNLVAAYDNSQLYALQTINLLLKKEKTKYDVDLRYLTGLLNSNVLNYYYDKVFNISSGLTTAIATENLELLTIKIASTDQMKQIIEIVKRLEKDPKNTDLIDELNKSVYDIYGLKKKDWDIIEENMI